MPVVQYPNHFIAPRDAQSLLIDFLFAPGDTGVNGVGFNDPGLVLERRKPGESWTAITPVTMTFGTWVANGWVEDPGNDAEYTLYQYGVDNADVVAGSRVLYRYQYTASAWRHFAVEYTGSPATTGGTTGGGGITFNIQVPGQNTIITEATTVFTKEQGRVIKFVANENIEAIPLKVIFEQADQVDFWVANDVDLTKTGNEFTVPLPTVNPDFTASAINLTWAVRREDNEWVFGQGSFGVTYAPEDDST